MAFTKFVKPKFALKSINIWGLILMAAPLVGELIGFEITDEDVATGTNVVDTTVKAISGGLGFILGLYGRWKAGRVVAPISIVPNAPAVPVVVETDKK